MKKSKLLVFGVALFSMMMIFSSCAKYPQTEIDVAKTAISETKDLCADVYVPEAYQALVDSMTSVETKIEAKKSNFFKTYKNEKISLLTIGQMSTDVKAKTEEYIENFATPYQAAIRGMVDMVIQPKDSRPVIINALHMLESKRESRPAKRHGNIPL